MMHQLNIDLPSAGFRGCLFVPRMDAEKAVIVLTGSEGGVENAKMVANLLAEEGYLTLAVGYCKLKGLPETLSMVPLEYVENAVKWIRKWRRGAVKKIALYGWSKGAELALLSASRIPEVTGVIALSPSCYVWEGIGRAKYPSGESSWSYQNQPVSFVPLKEYAGKAFLQRAWEEKTIKTRFLYEEAWNQAIPAEAKIPVENIQGNILLVSSSQDEIWLSKKSAERLLERLEQSDFPHRYRHINFERVGHFLAPFLLRTTRIFASERKYPRECRLARQKTWMETLAWLEKM